MSIGIEKSENPVADYKLAYERLLKAEESNSVGGVDGVISAARADCAMYFGQMQQVDKARIKEIQQEVRKTLNMPEQKGRQ